MAEPNRDQLMEALRRADAAGDTPAAQAIARRISSLADFSGVSSRVLPEPEPAPRTLAQDAGRSLGLGARSAIQGIYDVAGIAFDPLAAGYQAVTGRPQATSSERGQQLSDVIGLPTPENRVERVSGNITSAVTGGGGLIGAGRQLAARAPGYISQLGQLLSSQPGAQIAGSALGAGASGVTREAGGGQGAQLAAGLAGSLVPSGRRVGADAASGALSRSVTPERKELARQAQERGIELTPAQLSDSRFLKWAQSALRSVPFTGAQGRFDKQVGTFNRALAEEVGERAENLGPDVLSRVKRRQSEKFDELTSRNALRVDDKLIQSLSNVAEMSRVSPQMKEAVEAAIDSLYSRATTGPGGVVIPGAAYQAFDSELNQIIRSGGPQAHFLGNVQTVVRRAMDASISPKDADDWRQLRREYGARKTLTPLAAKSESGEIRPAQVLGAVTASKAGKEAQATGRSGGLGTLARIGQIMKEPPSSGTAERIGVSSLLGGASVIDPVSGTLTAAGLNLLSRGLDSRALARLMIQENPGLTAETAQEIIRRSTVPAAITAQQTNGNP